MLLMFTQQQTVSDAIGVCSDCKAVILTISRDLERSHVKEIGDAIERATRAHKCRTFSDV
jgi:hypothetical protein